MLSIKKGVKLHGLVPQVLLALRTLEELYAREGWGLVITSGVEGTHKRQSAHYSGRAIDIRTNNLPTTVDLKKLVADAQTALGVDFDVVLESDHIHLEWDPKEND